MLDCEVKHFAKETAEYKILNVPKERYYIPMFMNENWERNLNTTQYIRSEQINKPLYVDRDLIASINDKDKFKVILL